MDVQAEGGMSMSKYSMLMGLYFCSVFLWLEDNRLDWNEGNLTTPGN